MVQKVVEKVKLSFVTAGIFGLGFLLYYLICLGSYQNYVEDKNIGSPATPSYQPNEGRQ